MQFGFSQIRNLISSFESFLAALFERSMSGANRAHESPRIAGDPKQFHRRRSSFGTRKESPIVIEMALWSLQRRSLAAL